MSTSVDGFVAGVNQRLEAPFGDGPRERLHRWMFERPEENAAALGGIVSAKAYVLGRNMFGPGRGAWDETRTGWWGRTRRTTRRSSSSPDRGIAIGQERQQRAGFGRDGARSGIPTSPRRS
jgi:hypothetical protein